MRTPRGTPYATLRALALSGAPIPRTDCEDAEHAARIEHACGYREIALLHLLCARALWSAWRANPPRSED